MNSIRNKFFVQLSSLVIFVIILLLLANNFMLQKYYIERKKDVFEEYYKQILEIESTEYLSSTNLFRQIELTTNADITIVAEDNQIVYSSRQIDDALPPRQVPLIDSSNEQFEFVVISTPEMPGESLILRGQLDNGYRVELRVQISAIQENITYVNEFLLYVGIVSVVVALIVAFLLSNHFAKPIREINKAAKKMKELDFSQLLEISSKDEIGELSESINNMADTLSKTFENLKEELSTNKKLSKKRRELLNNVSHELKTPLSLIQGYAEGLILNIDTSVEKRDYYTKVIMDEAKNMNRIIEDLLEMEDVDSHFNVNVTRNVELIPYISGKINKHKITMKEKSITLIEQYDHQYNVDMDTYLTDRIITNYIVNAINYCEPNGKIIVSMEQIEEVVRVKVFNTFSGFNEEESIHIWDTFYKVDQARTRDVGGHGLGLSIVKSIQEKLNLGYGVQNKSEGVEFWFDVNIAK